MPTYWRMPNSGTNCTNCTNCTLIWFDDLHHPCQHPVCVWHPIIPIALLSPTQCELHSAAEDQADESLTAKPSRDNPNQAQECCQAQCYDPWRGVDRPVKNDAAILKDWNKGSEQPTPSIWSPFIHSLIDHALLTNMQTHTMAIQGRTESIPITNPSDCQARLLLWRHRVVSPISTHPSVHQPTLSKKLYNPSKTKNLSKCERNVQ